MIQPTVGRILHFFPSPGDRSRGDGPLAAIVAAVINDRCVNVAIIDSRGRASHEPATNVTLMQEGDAPPSGEHCRWMKYQIGQAQKNDAEIASVREEIATALAALSEVRTELGALSEKVAADGWAKQNVPKGDVPSADVPDGDSAS